MVVIVIMGILTSFVAVRVLDRVDEARITQAKTQIDAIKTALELYKLDNGTYPSTDQGLEALVTEPTAGTLPGNGEKTDTLKSSQRTHGGTHSGTSALENMENTIFHPTAMTGNLEEKTQTRISTAGMLNNKSTKKLSRKNIRGFTLVEMTLVILIAGLMLAITVPVVRDTVLQDNLKTVARKTVAEVRYLRSLSVSEYRDHLLMFDITEGKYWYETADMGDEELLMMRDQAYVLPDDVKIVDINVYGAEKKTEGEVGIRFSKKGYIRYSLIHLADDKNKRKFTLVVEPFLGKVKIMEDYLDFDDVTEKDK